MSLISKIDPNGFNKYLNETGNTICGRHPIAVCLFMLTAYNKNHSDKNSNGTDSLHKLFFTRYEQSSPARSISDSSVSYASAVITRI